MPLVNIWILFLFWRPFKTHNNNFSHLKVPTLCIQQSPYVHYEEKSTFHSVRIDQLLPYHHHHHHHLFLKRPFLPRSARAPIWGLSTHPWTPPIQGANQARPCLPLHILSMFSYLCPHISPQPPPHFYRPTPNHLRSYVPHAQKQSTMPHHFCHALNIQKTVQVLTSLPILQRHTTHPSHHHTLCSLQATQILSLHCPCHSPIYQHALDTGPKNLLFHAVWCTTSRQNGR